MSTYLSESLIIEILSWLPVTSLIRFKRVNKSWYKIIKNPYFISMHLKHGYGRRRTNCFIAQFVVTPASKVKTQLLRHGRESDKSINTIQDFNSLHDAYNYYDICGPCYGIYYLWCSWPSLVRESRRLWNPALNEIKYLPPMIMKPNISSNMKYFNEFCGFGFDPVTVDYKVVSITGYLGNNDDRWDREYLLDCPLSIMIYSLRADSWKYLGDLSKRYYIRHNSCHTFVNRNFYWLGSYEKHSSKHDVIIAIDLTTEESQEIGLPDMRMKKEMFNSYSECLMVYNGSIALVAFYDWSSFDIWTLKGTTWSKELTLQLDCWVDGPVGHYSVDNNLVLFYSRNCLLLCDPNTGEMSRVESCENEYTNYCKTVSAYMESLVPLNDRDFWG